jgi:hypothetical protein
MTFTFPFTPCFSSANDRSHISLSFFQVGYKASLGSQHHCKTVHTFLFQNIVICWTHTCMNMHTSLTIHVQLQLHLQVPQFV